MCKRICELVLAIVLIVLGLLRLSVSAQKWALIIAGIVLLIHAFWCKKCCCDSCSAEAPKKSVARAKRKK